MVTKGGVKGTRVPVKLPWKGATNGEDQFAAIKKPVADFLKFNVASKADLTYYVEVQRKDKNGEKVGGTKKGARRRRPGNRTRSIRLQGEATDNCNRTIRDLVIDGRLIITAANIEKNIVRAAKNMDKYREKLGNKAIIPTSWYRPSNVNASVGGTKWSRHQYGDAVDWVCSHLSPAQIAAKLESQHNDGGYKCYVRQNFTHTD